MSRIYVIGHINPDTDSIAAAVGYAWLLRERDGEDAVAARAGAPNPQTTWVLKRLGIDAPQLLTDASPRFEMITRRVESVAPENPLLEAWDIFNRAGGIAPVVEQEDGKPLGLITGYSLMKMIADTVGPNPRRQDMRIGEIMSIPCREACDSAVPKFQASTRIRDMLNRLLREEHNDFLTVDEKGVYIGVFRQRDALNPPRLRLILVDHNEPGQAVGAVEEAELIEILDHHRLGNMYTHAPIRFSVDVVGSTSTLVAERIHEAGLSAPPFIAGLLLAGLLADTLTLTSPTTTERDRRAAERLARSAFARNGPLANETISSYGNQVLRSGTGLATRDSEQIVTTDFKLYEGGGLKFAISQVEVTDLLQLDENLENLKKALNEMRERKGLDFAMLMVTDVVESVSRLVLVNEPAILEDLPYPRQPDGTRLAPGVVSRKKQLLPTVLGLLEV